ncbi:MAG: HET-C-related protein [Candidatus Electrothrix aestuarii]|uniref:HET-C-related protein n=1 Tax=Candidatus Electrothrix aestuarii TaxID=3062594 RepID=A0AAU8M200_9BACT|nr:HET-C-related protein [Candidatus Electrothrix aestuarii]
MNIDKHRAISYCAFKRCYDLLSEDLKNNSEYQKIFYPLWMGNWLTDINQTSAFFSFIPERTQDLESDNDPNSPGPVQFNWLRRCIGRKELERMERTREDKKSDYYQNRKDGSYVLPSIFHTRPDFSKRWENLIAALWGDEWTSTKDAWKFSKDMGEMEDFLSLEEPSAPGVTTGTAEEIGVYFPLDHFDVTDQYIIQGNEQVLDNREASEFAGYKNRDFMTSTVQEALKYTKQDWLKKAFDATQDVDPSSTQQNRLTDYQALKLLGHGLHTLQDFYAHSNYSDLLLICLAEERFLDEYWNKRIHHLAHKTEVGTFNAFVLHKEPSTGQRTGKATPVVTGRFDPIDTVHTLLHLAIDNIHSHDEETHTQENKKDGKKEKEDRLLHILFNTFSDLDIIQKVRGPIELYLDFSRQIDQIQAGISHFFMNYLVDPLVKDILQGQDQFVDAYLLLKDVTLHNEERLREYRKAGELLFHQHTIENYLRKEITEAEESGRMILPHHALLAKDQDKTNDAVKLSYKLSCALAAEASTEVLVKYFQGASFSELEPLLKRRYVHPQFHIEQGDAVKSLRKAISSLNVKWFWYALQNPKNNQSILGFDMSN